MNYPRFQFHYGSIKGISKIVNFIVDTVFQFHYGSIKGTYRDTLVPEAIGFQFHYGSIKGFVVVTGRLTGTVSIPLWFD